MRSRLGACLECGKSFERGVQPKEFCDDSCRKAWGNRRMLRGAEMYDILMAHRFEREEAKDLGAFQAFCRLASNYRAEDREQREGRRSWRRLPDVLAERPHLKSSKTQVRAGR